jgi:hypothetical protein
MCIVCLLFKWAVGAMSYVQDLVCIGTTRNAVVDDDAEMQLVSCVWLYSRSFPTVRCPKLILKIAKAV